MNDYVIRFTPKEDDVSYEQLLGLIKSVIDEGTEPSGWKVLQHGEFDKMAGSMGREKGFVDITKISVSIPVVPYVHSYPCPICDGLPPVTEVKFDGELAESERAHWIQQELAKEENNQPLLSFDGDSAEMTRMMKQVMSDHQFGPLNYTIPVDGDYTESLEYDPGKKWIGSIYCPDLPVGSITNRSEDSIGGVAKIVTHDRTCECKCYGWEEIERKLAAEQREKLKNVYISPEAMEELKNWNVVEIDNGTIITDECFLGAEKYQPVLDNIMKGLGIPNEN